MSVIYRKKFKMSDKKILNWLLTLEVPTQEELKIFKNSNTAKEFLDLATTSQDPEFRATYIQYCKDKFDHIIDESDIATPIKLSYSSFEKICELFEFLSQDKELYYYNFAKRKFEHDAATAAETNYGKKENS